MEKMPTVVKWIIPIGKILLFFIVFSLITGVLHLPLTIIWGVEGLTNSPDAMFYSTLFNVVAVFCTVYIFQVWIDKLKMKDIGLVWRGHSKEFIAGCLLATAMMVGGFLIVLAGGGVTVASVQFSALDFLKGFVLFVAVSVFEEVMTRGYLLNYLMRKINRFVALALSSIIFALMHAPNSHIDTVPMINLFLAGCLLGSTYIYTRNLWFPIGLHLFWNFVQGPVLGFNVSGTETTSIFTLNYPENTLFNGGLFGLEGSIVTTILSVIAIAGVIYFYETRKKTVVIPTEASGDTDPGII